MSELVFDASRDGALARVPRARRRLVLSLAAAVAVALASLLGSSSALAAGKITKTFHYTGEEQTFTVPAGVSGVEVLAVGGSGGSAETIAGGLAAKASGSLTVKAGETLYVEVGGKGATFPIVAPAAGGFNGGGNGAGGGGGASDVRTAARSAGLSPDTRLVIAAGGGGAGQNPSSCRGSHGGNAGQAGEGTTCEANAGGEAGTASAGGKGGEEECGDGAAGALGEGGHGGGPTFAPFLCSRYGGGGGGGLYGGGGGAGAESRGGGGGAGGSSKVPGGGTVELASLGAEPEVKITYTSPGPLVETRAASSVEARSATLNATVSPEGETVTACKFQYGTTESYGSEAPCVPSPGSGFGAVAVSASLSGLSGNATYHFRIVATTAGGTTDGEDAHFTTAKSAPTVMSQAATMVTQTSATLNASVNPEDETVTSCRFQYGPTNTYGSEIACKVLPGSGGTPVEVSASLTGLTSNSTYHFRIVATNATGTNSGEDTELVTNPFLPTVTTEAASAVTQTTATMNGTVNPQGETVSNCHFEYGATTRYGSELPCEPSLISGSSNVPVAASLTDLAPHETLHFRLVATNHAGTSFGADEIVTTLAPPAVVTGRASAITQTTATLGGTVNPEGKPVTACHFEYGTTEAYGNVVPCEPTPEPLTTPVSVSAPLTRLGVRTIYDYRIVATTEGGTSFGTNGIFETLPNPPTVTLLAPDGGPEGGGTEVTITGTEFAEASQVRFGTVNATTFNIKSPTEITAVAPVGEGTVDVTVRNPGGWSTTGTPDQFTYVEQRPAVTKLSTKKGLAAGGTVVTISGSGFLGATGVKFGTDASSHFTVNSNNSLTAVTPAGTSGPVNVTVSNSLGRSTETATDLFTYLPPTVTKVTPSSGPVTGGTSVTVEGSGFAVGSTETIFMFGRIAATTDECTSTTVCIVVSPQATKAARIDVRARVHAKTSKKTQSDRFTYETAF